MNVIFEDFQKAGAETNAFLDGQAKDRERLRCSWRAVIVVRILRLKPGDETICGQALNAPRAAGQREILWEGANDAGVHVAAGVYIMRLHAEEMAVRRVTVTR